MGIHVAQAVGHLHYLWWWALDYARTGDLSDLTDLEIATASEWHENPEKFCEILIKNLWLTKDKKLNDWMDYGGNYIRSLARQKRYRKKTLKLRNSNVTEASRVTSTVHNSTVHNITEPTTPTPSNIPDDLVDIRADVEAWLAYKRERGQEYKSRGLNALWVVLRAIPPPARAESITRSMANNWAGIFPPKGELNDRNNGAVPTSNKYAGIEKRGRPAPRLGEEESGGGGI